MVDLWSADGEEPTTLDEVQTRQKDVTFASRSARHLDDYVATHKLQQKMRALYQALPEQARNELGEEYLKELGCETTLHIVRLPYKGRDWNMAAKDINFSQGSIEWRWNQGYQDAMRAIQAAGWLSFVTEDTPLVVHELPPLPLRGQEKAA
jgi:NTE family protein